MTLRSFSGGSGSKLGLVRSMVLLVVGVALVVLMTLSVMDQHCNKVCVEEVQKDSSEVDGVLRKDLKQPLNQSSADPKPSLIPWDYNWDFKAANSPADIKKIPDRSLILVRHGDYDFETRKLTRLGREQADLTGRRLKEMNLTYTAIVHSTLDRAAETAQIIHGHLPHVPLDLDDMLREGGPIPPNPTVSYGNFSEHYFASGPRLEAAFRKYFYRPGREQQIKTFEILVGHSNIFRFFVLRVLQLPIDAWMRVTIGHASITMLNLRADGTVKMTKFGDTGHMPNNKVTY